MLHFLPSWFKGILTTVLFVANTVICGTLVTILVPMKVVIPWSKWRNFWTKVMIGIGSMFILINKGISLLVHRIIWDISGLNKLDLNRQYLVLSNHQSSVDIPVIQGMFHKIIPFHEKHVISLVSMFDWTGCT